MPPETESKETKPENETKPEGSDDAGRESEREPEDVSGLKSALGKERDARKAAADRAKTAEAELATLRQKETEREDAERQRQEQEAEQKGEFETLAKKREEERDAAKADVARLTAENDQLRAAMASGIEAGWKDLPETVRKLGEKSHPEDDVLGRWTFLHDADTTALVKQLSEKTEHARGNGRDPKAGGMSGKANDETARAANALRYR